MCRFIQQTLLVTKYHKDLSLSTINYNIVNSVRLSDFCYTTIHVIYDCNFRSEYGAIKISDLLVISIAYKWTSTKFHDPTTWDHGTQHHCCYS